MYLHDEDALKVEMLHDFLRHEFTRDVGRGTEYLYRISESIAKSWFDLPPEVQDAWCYPSIVDQNLYNIAFRPRQRSKLRLLEVQIGTYRTSESGELELQPTWRVTQPKEGVNLVYRLPQDTSQANLMRFSSASTPLNLSHRYR